MRIYVPATIGDLRDPAGLGPRGAHALTGALRAALAGEDDEAGEFQALLAAAAASVDLLAERPDEPALRVVVAADVDGVQPDPRAAQPSAVRAPQVPWDAVVSFHVDDPDDPAAHDLVRRAARGEAGARDAAEDLDLLWYDVTERPVLTARW